MGVKKLVPLIADNVFWATLKKSLENKKWLKWQMIRMECQRGKVKSTGSKPPTQSKTNIENKFWKLQWLSYIIMFFDRKMIIIQKNVFFARYLLFFSLNIHLCYKKSTYTSYFHIHAFCICLSFLIDQNNICTSL